MADDCSRLWKLSDSQLLHYFNLKYTQELPWTLCPLRPEIHSSPISALIMKRAEPQSFVPKRASAQDGHWDTWCKLCSEFMLGPTLSDLPDLNPTSIHYEATRRKNRPQPQLSSISHGGGLIFLCCWIERLKYSFSYSGRMLEKVWRNWPTRTVED